VCDQVTSNLFDKTPWAYELTSVWTERDEEFVKRAGFVLMAALAVHDKTGPDEAFLEMLTIIESRATDDRNFVKRAVNWALRQIGKRSLELNAAAADVAARLAESEDRAARWVGKDAFRELSDEKTRARIKR
jgi:3-methyladenine DNA glycosylase AlkD